MIMNIKQKNIKIESRIKLNYNIFLLQSDKARLVFVVTVKKKKNHLDAMVACVRYWPYRGVVSRDHCIQMVYCYCKKSSRTSVKHQEKS